MRYEIKLGEVEHDHLAACSQCMNAMVSAIRDNFEALDAESPRIPSDVET